MIRAFGKDSRPLFLSLNDSSFFEAPFFDAARAAIQAALRLLFTCRFNTDETGLIALPYRPSTACAWP